jgi:hypothetical protein
LRFGRYSGERVGGVPVDYVSQLRQFPALWATTRRAIVAHLLHLARHPGEAALSFGKHSGEPLEQIDTRYLDWALGTDWIGPATRWLVGAELGRRCGYRLHYDAWGNVIGRLEDLPGIDDRPERGDTRSFTPAEGLLGAGGRLPSSVTYRNPQAREDDERVAQDLELPPASVGQARRDRNKVLWASVAGQPTLRADDADADRVYSFADAIEAVEQLATAPSPVDLERLRARAEFLVTTLAQAEGWSDDSNPLLDELDAAYHRRRDQLAAGEIAFTDAPRKVEPAARTRGRACPESARVFEQVRRLLSCRTREELLDVAAWIARHRAEFSPEAIVKLRGWYSEFRAELIAAD